MAPHRSFATLCLLVACGARTGLDEPQLPDATPPDAAPDVSPDVPLDLAPDLAPDVAPDRPPDATPFCGDNVREGDEECDLGAGNALLPALALSQPGRPEVPVRPVVRRMTAASFYGYRSASAHTGFERVGLANVFLYVNTLDNDLGLLFFAGRDDDGSMPAQPDSTMEVFFRGVPTTASIALSDDPGELARPLGADVHGAWSFNGNTDGGALAGLPWSTPWRIVLETTFRAGVSTVQYVDGDGRPRTLLLREAIVLEHRVTRALCRPDCRLSRCGDGYVDASERCDDGNTRPGDGCAADCQRIE